MAHDDRFRTASLVFQQVLGNALGCESHIVECKITRNKPTPATGSEFNHRFDTPANRLLKDGSGEF